MADFTVGNIIIEEDLAVERFACDLSRCKGACCTLPGGRGAPVLPEEVDFLLQAVPVVRKYLPSEHLRVIDSVGVVEETDGSYFTVCVDDKACVFVCFEQGVARCAIERAYLTGEFGWWKPLSCHLFPIRRLRDDRERIRYDRINECSPAKECGNKNNVRLHDFIKDGLIRAYGETWYEEFRTRCKQLDTTNQDKIIFSSKIK